MEFKNAFSILVTKFDLVYRVILFVLLVLLLVSAIAMCFLLPTMKNIKSDEHLVSLYESAKTTATAYANNELSFKEGFESIREDALNAKDYINNNTSTRANLVIMVLVMFVLYRFAITLCYVSITDIMQSFMTSNMRYSFFSNLIKNFRTSLSFSGGYAVVFIPIDLLLCFFILFLVSGLFPLLGVFAFSAAMAAGIFIFALRMTLMSGILPYMIMEKEGNFFKAFKKSMPMVKANYRGFMRSVTLALLMYFTLTVSTIISTAGLIPVLSVSMLTILVRILELCYYFRYKKAKYYIDFNMVVDATPFGEREDLIVDRLTSQAPQTTPESAASADETAETNK